MRISDWSSDVCSSDLEVADLGGIQFLLVVIFGDVARADATRRQHADEAQHRALDQMDRGRFQRLHEAARQAAGDAIAIPLPPPYPGGEAPEIGQIGRASCRERVW